MKQSFETSKLYYGFPILSWVTRTRHGYNVTTCSSSYSLEIGWSSGLVARKMRQTRLSIIRSSQ